MESECVICFCVFKKTVSSKLDDDEVKGNKCLKEQLILIFLLRKIFRIPISACANFLTLGGNPSSWPVNFCPSCECVVEEAKFLFRRLSKLEAQFVTLIGDIQHRFTSCYENSSTKNQNDSLLKKIRYHAFKGRKRMMSFQLSQQSDHFIDFIAYFLYRVIRSS